MKQNALFGLGILLLASGGTISAYSTCPDLGTKLVGETITDSTDINGNPATQSCPGIQIGVGLPLIGQIKIIVLQGGTCPLSQTKVDPHAEIVPKTGFETSPNGTYDVWSREVKCNTSANLVVIGTGYCDYGAWDKKNSYPDYSEGACDPNLSVGEAEICDSAVSLQGGGSGQ